MEVNCDSYLDNLKDLFLWSLTSYLYVYAGRMLMSLNCADATVTSISHQIFFSPTFGGWMHFHPILLSPWIGLALSMLCIVILNRSLITMPNLTLLMRIICFQQRCSFILTFLIYFSVTLLCEARNWTCFAGYAYEYATNGRVFEKVLSNE